jgi:hypothetical protein
LLDVVGEALGELGSHIDEEPVQAPLGLESVGYREPRNIVLEYPMYVLDS